MSKAHTPTPWHVVRRRDCIGIAGLRAMVPLDDQGAADAAFCVRAANAHGALVAALREMPCIICERAVGAPPRDLAIPGLADCPGCKLARAALELAGEGT